MANEEHLAILRQGVEVWNEWRRKNLEIEPDLSGATLQGASLQGATLERTNFQRSNLAGVDLRLADLRYTDLTYANLQQANLIDANLFAAILVEASLQEAILWATNFQFVNLRGCSFNKADIAFVIFVEIDFRGVKDLDTVIHSSSSSIGIDTLYRSKGQIPESFLRGCGVPDSMIEYARALVAAERPIDYYSCFISYSSRDEMLAERLYADLQARGVRCWYAPHDMQIGEPILSGIDRGIRLHDKLLLILSESSVESGWVEQEVHMVLAREKTERRRVLFPIRIDDAVIKSRQGWPAILRDTIHIGDFRQWKQHDTYQAAFTRLLRDLKAEQA